MRISQVKFIVRLNLPCSTIFSLQYFIETITTTIDMFLQV